MGRNAERKQGKDHIRHYLKASGEGDEGVLVFLAANKGLLLKLAIQRFGINGFEEDEIMGMGYIYARSALKYMNRYKGQSQSTVAQWFFQKAVNSSAKKEVIFGVTEGATYSEDEISENAVIDKFTFDSCVDEDEDFEFLNAERFLPDMEIERHNNKNEEHIYEDHLKIHVCLESFLHRVPLSLYKVLESLNTENGIDAIQGKYNCARLNTLRSAISGELKNALNGTGLCVYLGSIKNGSISDVVVCAQDEKEADEYFRMYGAKLKLTLWKGMKKTRRSVAQSVKPQIAAVSVRAVPMSATKRAAVTAVKKQVRPLSLQGKKASKENLHKQLQLAGVAA